MKVNRGVTPNDPKLSDRGVRRGTCMVGGKAAVEAGAVTHGAVRCSAWLGDGVVMALFRNKLEGKREQASRENTPNQSVDLGKERNDTVIR